MPDLPLPVEFRKEIIGRVTAVLRSGESCALVGVGSSGKSNIARHLQRADVRLRYFESAAVETFVLYLNCKPFVHRQPHDLYLHALDRIASAAEELDGVFTALRSDIEELWQEAQAAPQSLARRNLDRAIGQVIRAGARHVIFILDDCDDLFAQAPPILFADLRALRDNYKVRVVYLTLTRREPAFLRDNAQEYEDLFELLSATGHTIAVPPYGEADAMVMLKRLAARQDPPREVPEAEAHRMFELSGGHAGLIRSIFFATRSEIPLLVQDVAERLMADADVEEECRKIWDSLDAEDHAAFMQLLNQEPVSDDHVHRLDRRGLVRLRPAWPPEIFSPVFERFLGRLAGLGSPGSVMIEFIGMGWQVRVNGRLIANLSRTEHDILHLLNELRPRLCPFADLVEVLYIAERQEQADRAQGDPLRRLEHHINQLRAKIGPPGQFIRRENDGYRLAA